MADLKQNSDAHDAHHELEQANGSIHAPLLVPIFRRIWLASLISNLGILILSVGAAWTMVRLDGEPQLVALVQTALMLPILCIAMPAGALADMFDRRKIGLIALGVSFTASCVLTGLAFTENLTPFSLLFFCFVIGGGMALFGPSWQASVPEQVPPAVLPQAVALNAISYNIARSFGPAVGGIIVATAGAVAGFATTAICYIPLLAVLFLWRREAQTSRLPPERIWSAIMAGGRYILHAPPAKMVLLRTFALGLAGGSISSLMPLVAHDLLEGTARTYGLILGAFGTGAVIGAMNVGRIRERFGSENTISLSALVLSGCIAIVAVSHWFVLTMAALVIAGAVWTGAVTLFNVNMQLSVPRWITGRALAAYQASIAGGIAIGSWLWGSLAEDTSVSAALIVSAATIAATTLLRYTWRLPDVTGAGLHEVRAGEMNVALDLTGRSGPINIELDYIVDRDDARAFFRAMQEVRPLRRRNGAYDWSLARDIADPRVWTERFSCPTWHDYLRMRDRNTQQEVAILDAAFAFHRGDTIIIRRRLERPLGSVRWRAETRDQGLRGMATIPPSSP